MTLTDAQSFCLQNSSLEWPKRKQGVSVKTLETTGLSVAERKQEVSVKTVSERTGPYA